MMDRSITTYSLRIVLAIGLLCVSAARVSAKAPSAKQALDLKPVQSGVEYERVPAESVEGCSVQDIVEKDLSGWQVIASDGTVLRRFVDTNDDKRIDLWCYFRYGTEVYRDVDGDFNGKADQYRWLGGGGSKWAIDKDENGKIDRWQRISAEEVTEELVLALATEDPTRFARLLATDSEIENLGLGAAKEKALVTKTIQAAREFQAFAGRQKAVAADANWVQFAAPVPGIFPAGTDGSTKDVLVYENAVAMFEQGGKNGQLNVGTLVKVGENWRVIDLPSIGADGEAVARADGNFFSQGGMSVANDGGANGGKTHKLVGELEEIDRQLSKATKSQFNALHRKRADLVERLIKESPTAQERATWVRQLVDTMSVAVLSGNFPEGTTRLRKVAVQHANKDVALQAYADYTAISTEYVTRQTPKAKFEDVQQWHLDALQGFIERYPRSLEAAQAMLQIALNKEFEDKEREALRYYRKVASNFQNSDPGEKAAGAVRRLESVGKRIELAGSTIQGKRFDVSSLRGGPVVIHYWATWCEQCKNDMKLLRRLQAQYKGLQLVGINVDVTRESAVGYLKENSLPWTQLFEPGGLEASPLSKSLGVQTLPTMLLLDKSGRVVQHNVRSSELADELDALK